MSIHFGTQNTNCLTYIPNDINLSLDPLNVSVVGSPTITNGVVSGFSTSAYVKTTGLDKTTTSFIAVFKTKVTTHKSYNVVLTFANSNYKIGFNSAGQLCTALGSWSAGTTKYATGTNIWVRLDWDGSNYKLYGLVDNGYTKHNLPAISSWTLEKTISNTTFYKGDLSIGFNSTTTSEYFQGSIDISQSFVNINGSNTWRGGTGILTLKKGSKVYVPNGKTEQKYYKISTTKRDTGTYTFTLDKEYNAKLLFVGNGGGGGSGQRDSKWFQSSGGSGACFEGMIKLPAGTYTVTIGTLGYGYNVDNNSSCDHGIDSTDSFLTDSNGNELIRVGCGARGTTSSAGGNGGTLTLGTLKVVTTLRNKNGNQGNNINNGSPSSTSGYALSAYDNTTTGYGAGTGSWRNGGNVYGIAGIFELMLESDSTDYDYIQQSDQNIFDEVVISSDISRAVSSSNSFNGMVFYNLTQNRLGYDGDSVCTSGTTPPTGSGFFYNTNDNTIKYYSSGTAGTDLCSLPVCLSYVNGRAGFSSIDQTFNGFGYIGSTVFALPNVKGLIPNGFNDDGTYKSIESNITTVQIVETPKDEIYYIIFGKNDGQVSPNIANYNYAVRENNSSDAAGFKYDNTTNKYIGIGSFNLNKQLYFTIVGSFKRESGKITSLTPNPVQPTKIARKIKKVYLGIKNTNCLTHIPQDINLSLDPLNVTVVGSPTVSSGVVSGFSSANYLTLPETTFPSSTSTSWEMVFKFTTNDSVSTRQSLYTQGKKYPSGIVIISSKVRLTISTSDGSYNIVNISGTTTLTANTTYWVKAEFTGSVYNLYLSTDGKTYTLENTKTTSNKMADTANWQIGYDKTDKYPFLGSIDLPNSYIKIDGSTWWKGGTGKLTLKKGSKVYVPNGWTEYKYYKYTYENWTQPTATSGTTAITGGNMVITGTNYYRSSYPWKAMDGTNSSVWIMSDTTTGYWQLKLPYKIWVTGLTFYNTGAPNRTKSGRFYTSSAKTTAIGNAFTATNSDYAATTISGIPSGGIETDTIYLAITGSYASSSGMGELKITAQVQTGSVESTSSDYDYKVGSGSMVFDEVVISKDISIATGLTTDTHERTLAVNVTNMNYNTLYTAESGTGYTGTGTVMYYNTTENLVQRYSSGVLQSYRLSLPIARIKADGSAIYGSISQVFNGFGYIGSSAYVLPGVKGLIPDGFNADGTYKSIVVEQKNVYIHNTAWSGTNTRKIFFGENQSIRGGVYYFIQSTPPTLTSKNYERWYNTAENLMYCHAENKTEWVLESTKLAAVGEVVSSSGKITSLTPNKVQPTKTGREITRIYKGSTVVYGYKPNKVMLEKSTAGTYTLNLEHSGDYEVTIVGGGGGGAYNVSTKFSDGVISGGSGAGFKGIIHLKAGTHTVKVGAGGTSVNPGNASTAKPGVGSSSSIGNIITAGCANADGTANAGFNGSGNVISKGGVLTYDKSAVRSYTIASNGNDGLQGWNTSVEGASSVISGTTYGAGDIGKNSAMSKGQDGYVKIVAV